MIRAVGRQIAEALAELHLNGLLHLDLSPSALVVRRDGRVLLTDPGLGIYGLPDVGGGRRGTIPNLTDPLPPYRSPEELCANRADQRSDLYALGCLLYTMATGSPAVLGARVLRNAWVHGQAYSHQDYRFGLAPEFDALVRDLLSTDPEYRPAHATEVLDRLLGTRPEDDELAMVARSVLALAPDDTRMGRVLRDAIDGVLDGEQTGRYDTRDMLKMEKTHLGTLVEIAIQREFRFEDGHDMDFRIAGIEVDCKFSLRMGGWMFPPETVGHICLLVWMDDYQSRWSAGLLRVRREWLNLSRNRDLKATLKAEHRNEIQWLWHNAELPENILLHMPDEDRRAVLEQNSGQARLNELFRRVQRRRIGHNVVRTVVQQKDYMKRVRGNGGARSALRREGIIIMGDYQAHQDIARHLGLPVPRAGEFVSARVVPAVSGTGLPVAEIDGQLWSVGSPEDPVAPAPVLPPHPLRGGSGEHGHISAAPHRR
ncbi:NaeI family type II restriction endonuclease [Streptomyces cavourensis]